MSLLNPQEVSYSEIKFGQRWDSTSDGKHYAITTIWLTTYPTMIGYFSKDGGIKIVDPNFKVEWLDAKRDNGESVDEAYRIIQVKGMTKYYKSKDVALGYYRVAGPRKFKEGSIKRMEELKSPHWVVERRREDYRY